MRDPLATGRRIVSAIARRRLSIYDPIEIGDSQLWIPTPELEALLNRRLRGLSLKGLPLRTRSKVVKAAVCRALGYPVPDSFRKTKPRFPGQLFDTYIQKSNNLQVWNEEISPDRRYVVIRVSPQDVIERVRVVTGDTLARFDTTGTLTQKYQARLNPGVATTELIAGRDTDNLLPILRSARRLSRFRQSPIDHPDAPTLLPIREIYNRLRPLVEHQFPDTGHDQERGRGATLHRLVCQALGYSVYHDDGRFPDVRNQLLEVKLQTSPTIDLGLVRPDSHEVMDIPQILGQRIRHCDIRYALFYGYTDGVTVTLTHLYVSTGEAFFSRFPQFGGKVLNKKLQIPLPAGFFDT